VSSSGHTGWCRPSRYFEDLVARDGFALSVFTGNARGGFFMKFGRRYAEDLIEPEWEVHLVPSRPQVVAFRPTALPAGVVHPVQAAQEAGGACGQTGQAAPRRHGHI
jgi:hypothetical protein